MASKPESKLQKQIQKDLKAMWPRIYLKKTHGGIYTSGEPDLVGCLEGRYFGFEVKVPGKERTLTALQAAGLNQILQAGGIAEMITSTGEAIYFLKVSLIQRYIPSAYELSSEGYYHRRLKPGSYDYA